jgi:hypothetical protein
MQAAALRFGHTLSNRGDSLRYHWAKHVILQEQWDPQLSEEDYLGYLRDAVTHTGTDVLLSFDSSARTTLYFIARTDDVIPQSLRGAGAATELMVI